MADVSSPHIVRRFLNRLACWREGHVWDDVPPLNTFCGRCGKRV